MIDASKLEEMSRKLKKDIEESTARIRKDAQALVKEALSSFFAGHPSVYAIGWTQYTPYWQDGEACEFRVNDINLYLTKDSFENGDWYDGDQNIRGERDAKGAAKIEAAGGREAYEEICRDYVSIRKLLKSVDDQYMELVFGDHVSVLCTASGITVEEYEHD